MRESIDRLVSLRRTTTINAGLMAYSAAIWLTTGNKAFLAEALHDASDTLAHGGRYKAELTGIDQETPKFRRLRKAAFFTLSALSAGTAVKFGVDIFNGSHETQDLLTTAVELGSATVIASGNVYAYKQMKSVEDHSPASHDSHHHSRTDMIASVGLAACIAADSIGLNGASEWGGMAFASYTAVELFPTDAKLDCHKASSEA